MAVRVSGEVLMRDRIGEMRAARLERDRDDMDKANRGGRASPTFELFQVRSVRHARG